MEELLKALLDLYNYAVPIHDKAFYIALFFILGIAGAGIGWNVWIILIAAFLLSKVFFSLDIKTSSILLFTTFIGVFYLNFFDVTHKAIVSFGADDEYIGLVGSKPSEGIESTSLEVSLYEPHRGTVYVYTEPDREYRYGDVVFLRGEVKKSQSGSMNFISFPDIEIIERDQGSRLRSILFTLKDSLISNIEKVLPADKSALMAGVLLGERAEFTDEFEEAMRNSGTTHIVALSGYNVAILAVLINALFSRLWGKRKSFYLSMLIIPAFVIMTGAEPSVVRAGIMGMILLLAEHQGRAYSFRNAIALTAFAMLLFDPRALTDDVGFQLSFAALLGLVYIQPWLTKRLKVLDDGFLAWKKNALQTTSAQIAVLPIIMTTFGFFSPTALISNVLILEVIPITMLLGFMTSILGFVSFHLSLVVGWLANVFLSYEVLVINLFGFSWL